VTNRGVAVLAFKLVGLWLMANAAIGIAGVPYFWEPQFDQVRDMTVFFTVLPLLVAVGIGVPVWFSADWFADRIFPNQSPQPMALDGLRGEPLFALALSVLGVFFAAEALPVVVNGAALFLQSRQTGSRFLGPDVDQQTAIWSAAAKANVTAGIARFLIGMGLLAGPARLASAVARIRKELRGSIADEAGGEHNGHGVDQTAAADDAASSEPPARK
jgi:hypothetical protein